jgi:hypothetical protein
MHAKIICSEMYQDCLECDLTDFHSQKYHMHACLDDGYIDRWHCMQRLASHLTKLVNKRHLKQFQYISHMHEAMYACL